MVLTCPRSLHAAPNSPPSPLIHKRRRLETAANASLPPSSAFVPDVDMDSDREDDDHMGTLPVMHGGVTSEILPLPPSQSVQIDQPTPHNSGGIQPQPDRSDMSVRPPPVVSPRTQRSVASLETASQTVRLALAAKEQSDKSTTGTYGRHIKAYIEWWDIFQMDVVKADPAKATIPALPITAAKATMFLNYTSTRAKVIFIF